MPKQSSSAYGCMYWYVVCRTICTLDKRQPATCIFFVLRVWKSFWLWDFCPLRVVILIELRLHLSQGRLPQTETIRANKVRLILGNIKREIKQTKKIGWSGGLLVGVDSELDSVQFLESREMGAVPKRRTHHRTTPGCCRCTRPPRLFTDLYSSVVIAPAPVLLRVHFVWYQLTYQYLLFCGGRCRLPWGSTKVDIMSYYPLNASSYIGKYWQVSKTLNE